MPSSIPQFFRSKQFVTGFTIVFISIYSFLPIESSATDSASTWFKEGIYAEYRFDSGSIWFLNGTFFSFPKEALAKATFRWECIYTMENTSRLNVTLSFDHETRDIWFFTLLDVNIKTRIVTLLNETYIGMTFLWLPPNLEENQYITITDGITGNVSLLAFANSPQGLQRAFWVMGTGEIDGHLIIPSGGYDLDTGLLLESGLWGEPTLLALGVLDPGLVGRMEFAATNIDLGSGIPKPEGLHAESLEVLLIAMPIGTFTLIFLAVFGRRRQRRKAAKTKRFKFKVFICIAPNQSHAWARYN